MTTSLLFGDCLRQIFEDRNARQPKRRWTSLLLAHELDVDPSLVRRWMRNERVPALDSEHVQHMMQALALSLDECRVLEAAQIDSLKALRRGTVLRRDRETDVVQLLRRTEPAVGVDGHPALATFPSLHVLPRHGGVIRSEETVLAAAIEMLERAIKLKAEAGATILLTFQGAHDIFESSPSRAQWQQLVRETLRLGWHMCHLWRLERDAGRSMRLVENMLAYLGGAGLYEPRYVTRYGVLAPPYDLFVVPGVGAMTLYATKQGHQIDAAIFSPEPEAVDVLSDHFSLLWEQSAVLLTSFNYPRDQREYHEALAATEAKPGGRFVVKDGLSKVTWPDWLLDAGSDWYRAAFDDAGDRDHFAERAQRRERSFQANVRAHVYRDICPKRAIERLVQTGQYSPDERDFRPGFVPSLRQRMQHIASAIETLQTHANFHLALIDPHEEDEIMHAFWAVQGDHTVLLETWRQDEHNQQINVGLLIAESTIAGAFLDYANELWNKISPRNRDKEYVIWWLQQQLEDRPAD